MPNWKKLIVSGSDATLNSLTVTTSGSFYDDLTISGSNSSLIIKGDGNKFARITHDGSGLIIDGGVQNQYISIGSPTWNYPNGVKVYGDLEQTGSAGGTATFEGPTQSTLNLKTTTNSKNNYIVGTAAGNLSLRPNGSESLILLANGNVGIGTSSPSTPLHINADAPTLRLQDATSGDNHYLTGNNGELRVQSSGFITMRPGAVVSTTFLANGNVGIGATNPGELLHLESTEPLIRLDDTNSGLHYIFGQDGDGFKFTTNNPTYGKYTFDTNVGIGTTSPSEKLDVSGNAIVRGDIVARDTYPSIYVNHSGTAMGGIRSDATNKLELKTLTTAPLSFQVNSSEKMRITSTGDVGIGTTSPSNQLHVYNTGNGEIKVERASGAQILLQAQASVGVVGTNSNHDLDLKTNGSTRIKVENTGNVGIGTTAPGAKLDVNGELRASLFRDRDDTNYYINPSGATSAILAGNVGIGTTSPGYKLDIDLDNVNDRINITAGGTQKAIINGYGNIIAYGSLTSYSNTLGGGGGIFNYKGGTATQLIGHRFQHVNGSFTATSGDQTMMQINPNINQTSTAGYTGIKLDVTETATGSGDKNLLDLQVDGVSKYKVNSDGDIVTSGDLTVAGTVTAQEFHTEFVSASIMYDSGSTKFGDTSDDNHDFTGSLNVAGDVNINSNYPSNAAANDLTIGKTTTGDHGITIVTSNANTAGIFFADNDNNDAGRIKYQHSNNAMRFDTNRAEAMRIDSSGNVGIGTTNPQTILHLNSGGSPSLRIQDSDGTDQYATINHNNGSNQYIARNNTSNGQHIWYGQTATSSFNERMRIDSSGNVGIGTTSPGAKLNVDGDFRLGNGAYTSIDFNADPSSHQGNGGLEIKPVTIPGSGVANWYTRFASNVATGTTNHNVTIDGNVGIGTTNPGEKLHVFGGAAAIEIDSTTNEAALKYDNSTTTATIKLANNDLKTELGGSERMRIKSTGQVQINDYGSGTFTGTVQSTLGVDSSGNIIEFTGGGGGSVSAITSGADTRVAYFNGTDSLEGSANFTWDDSTLDVTGNIEASYDASNRFTIQPLSNGNVYFKPSGGSIHVAQTAKNNLIFLYDYTGTTSRWGEYEASSLRLKTSTNTVGISLDADGNSYFANGNIGIGTTSPDYLFEVEKTTSGSATLASFKNTENTSIRISRTGTSPGTSILNVVNNGALYASSDSHIAFQPGNSTSVFLQNTGNVGIGTTSPSAQLQIDTPSANQSGQGLRLNRPSAGTNYHSVEFATNGTVDWSVGQNSNDAFEVYENGSAATTRLTIKEGGNVGIGTTSPSYKLDVAGNIRVDSTSAAQIFLDSAASNDAVLNFHENASQKGKIGYDTSLGGIALVAGSGAFSTADMVLLDGGNVGIGTTSPSNRLQVSDGSIGIDSQYMIRDNRNNTVLLQSASTAASNRSLTIGNATYSNIIVPNGNVGIGTSSPSYKLDVNGDIQNNGVIRRGGNVFIKSTGSETKLSPAGSGIISFHNSATMNTGDETMRIDANGNLLLNNTSAGARLDIREDTNYAIRAEDATGHYFRVNTGGDVDMRGDLVVQGTITAQQFHSEFVSASIIYDSGSTKFGDTSDDNHDFTGSLNLAGQLTVDTSVPIKLLVNGGADNDSAEVRNGSGELKIYSGRTTAGLHQSIVFASGDNYTSGATRMIITGSNGNVGIGTTSPTYKLDVENSGNIIANFESTTNKGAIRISDDDTVGYISAENGRIGFGTSPMLSTSNITMLTSNNNVGIGTTSPAQKLDILGNAQVQGVLYVTKSGENSRFNSADANGPYVSFRNNGTAKGFIGSGFHLWTSPNNLADNFGIRAENQLDFGIGASVKMTLDSSGNVGIGTTSPDARLEVVGSYAAVPLKALRHGDYGNVINIGRNGVSETANIGYPADSTINLSTAGSERVRINATGNVGIGTTNPGAKLHVDGTAIFDTQTGAQPFYITRDGVANQALKIYVDDSAAVFESIQDETADDYGSFIFKMDGGTTHPYFDIRKGNATQVRFDGSGNVGIGTTSPGVKLDVSGQIRSNDSFLLQSGTTAIGSIRNQGGALDIRGDSTRDVSLGSVTSPQALFVEGTNGNVGIGTTNPNAKVDIEGDLQVKGVNISNQENLDIDTGTETIATVVKANYDAAFFDYVVKNETNLRAGTVMAVHDGTNVEFTDNSTKDIGDTSGVTFSVDISGTDLRLRATTTSDNWLIKTLVKSI